jgi:hypothetical protein
MAHLWIELADQSYGLALLEGDAFGLIPDIDQPVVRKEAGRCVAHLCRYGAETDARWILLVASGAQVRVNGQAVWGGIRLLADRDEIHLSGGVSSFFSTEEPVKVEPYPGGGAEARCPRCQDPIAPGVPGVRCPNCGIWHHEDAAGEQGRGCWSYAPGCAVCGETTDLDAGYRWTPDEL